MRGMVGVDSLELLTSIRCTPAKGMVWLWNSRIKRTGGDFFGVYVEGGRDGNIQSAELEAAVVGSWQEVWVLVCQAMVESDVWF